MPNNNIYDVYIQHWYNRITKQPDSGSEKLMFSIPYSNPEGFPIVSPSVKCSEDSADSLDFTLNAGMEYYDLLIPFITLIRVEYYGNTIFYGRVLTINPSTVLQTKSIHCEGAYAFMNDSFYPAIADSKREELDWVNSLNNGYFDKILSNHNTYIDGDEHKKFYKGTIDSSLSGKKKKYEPTGWSQTSSLLSSLKDEIGGHMLARYSGGYNYLDWYKYAKRDLGDSRPRVEVGENVIDISGNMDVGNLFTRVIPVGKNDNDGTKMSIAGYKFTNVRTGQEETIQTDYMPVSTVLKLYQDSDLTNDYHTPDDFTNSEARHSIIYKTVQFSDAATQKELFEECAKWIKESYYGTVTSLEIRAIDMKIVNSNVTEPILIGDCVDIYYKIMENGQMVTKYRKMVCKSVKYDLFNPSNNSYTFGIPSDLLKVSKSQSSSSNKKKTASQTISTPTTDDTPPDMSLTFKKIADIIRKDPAVAAGYGGDAAADSFEANGEMSGTRLVYDADLHYLRDPDDPNKDGICFNGQIVGIITLPDTVKKWVAFNNAHGLFAYIDTNAKAVPTMHWYTKESGYSYTNPKAVEYSVKGSVLKVIGAAENIRNAVLEMNIDANNLPTTKWFNPKKALEEQKAVASIHNITGTICSIVGKVGLDGTGDDNTTSIVQDGATAKTTFYDNLAGNLSTRKTIEQNGLTGETSFYGTDTSSGITKKVLTALVSGFGGGSFDLSSLDTNKGISMVTDNGKNIISTVIKKLTGEKETTAEISGSDKNNDGSSDTSIGKIKVGKNLAAGAAAGYKVVMNESQAYKGYRVNSQGQGEYFDTWGDGFVFANDLKLDSIPSFRTEKAVIDKLWADQATVNSLTVNNDAWIKDLTGETAKVAKIIAKHIRAGEKFTTSGYVSASNFELTGVGADESSEGSTASLKNCFSSCLFTPETDSSGKQTGKITATFGKIGGGKPVEASFNMADTAWHKSAVSASFDSDHSMYISGAGSPDKITSVTLDPGESKNYYPTFKKKATNEDGSATYQYGSLINVTARSVTHNPVSSELVVNSGDPGSSYILRSITIDAKTKWFKYTTTCNDETNYYKVKATTSGLYTTAEYNAAKAEVPSGWYSAGWLVYASSSSGADHQGTLGYDSYIRVMYNDSSGNPHYSPTWKTPADNSTSHSISITPNNVGQSSNPGSSYTELWSTTNFVSNRWYTFTVKCGTAERKYKIHIT